MRHFGGGGGEVGQGEDGRLGARDGGDREVDVVDLQDGAHVRHPQVAGQARRGPADGDGAGHEGARLGGDRQAQQLLSFGHAAGELQLEQAVDRSQEPHFCHEQLAGLEVPFITEVSS